MATRHSATRSACGDSLSPRRSKNKERSLSPASILGKGKSLGLSPHRGRANTTKVSLSAGCYLDGLLEPGESREPELLASTHHTNASRRATVTSRRGLRHKRNNKQPPVRRVSLLSQQDLGSNHSGSNNSGSNHSAVSDLSCLNDAFSLNNDDSFMNASLMLGQESTSSCLDESHTSFFGDDSYALGGNLLPEDISEEMNPAPAPASNKEHHRTFEDMSLQAQTDTQADDENYEMEISPGVYLPFRGSKETWQAVHEGTALETGCLECSLSLISVPDCQCVVCPDCKMVNPIFEHPSGTTVIHGVGMGLQKEWTQQRRQEEHDFTRRRRY